MSKGRKNYNVKDIELNDTATIFQVKWLSALKVVMF